MIAALPAIQLAIGSIFAGDTQSPLSLQKISTSFRNPKNTPLIYLCFMFYLLQYLILIIQCCILMIENWWEEIFFPPIVYKKFVFCKN
jgi:hypothetical protein